MSDAGTDPTRGRQERLEEPHRRRWLGAALAFVGGLLVGGLAVGLAVGREDPPPAPMATPTASTPTPTPSGLAVTVIVPPACLEAVERAQVTSDLVREGIDAVRQLDTARLQQLAEQLQAQTPELSGLAQQCRDAAGRTLSTVAPPPSVP